MLNMIWAGMILLSFVFAALNGRLTELSAAVGNGAQTAVETSFVLIGGMCFWSGLMRIAEESGLIAVFSKWLSPVIRLLFPEYAGDRTVREKITVNIAANLFGMGNAATPAGLAAMDEMQKRSRGDMPTGGMILFVVMNTAALQVIPSSVVTLRSAYGSLNPYDIMPHVWLVSLGSLAVSLVMCRFFRRVWHR